ncbi:MULTISPECIES: protein kinase domain-containing protein [unclassified Frankia]|uniref:protein kinase domain-containing protein n=1 Tax=unclassified Frankia TaxID=2632575 RepID=UPI002AD49E7F|nr:MULTISPECIES: protein kinase [unclassified Frankia]
MQYLPAGSIADRIHSGGPLPVSDTLLIGANIADALNFAHTENIFHGDVKPGNILLTDTGQPILSDFGIASISGAYGLVGPDAFTPSYAAPEIMRKGRPSVAADIYALGVTLFTMLTGTPPFQCAPTEDPARFADRTLARDVPALPRDRVPEPVERLLRTALARDPARRPSTAAAFAEDLRRLHRRLGDSPTPDELPGTPRRRRHDRRDRTPSGPASLDGLDLLDCHDPTDDVAPGPGPAGRPNPRRGDEPTRYRPRSGQGGPADEPQSRRNQARWRWALPAATVVTLMIAAVAVAASGASGDRRTPISAPDTSTQGTSPTIDPAEIEAARPTEVHAEDHGDTVILTWRNGSRRTKLIMQPAASPVLGNVQSLPDGATFTTIADLGAAQGYCFRVGPLLAFDASAQKPVVAWSAFACIRGATPPSS